MNKISQKQINDAAKEQSKSGNEVVGSKIEPGDIVRTRTYDPSATYLEFEVMDVVNLRGALMAESEKYGQINVDLLKIVRKGADNA